MSPICQEKIQSISSFIVAEYWILTICRTDRKSQLAPRSINVSRVIKVQSAGERAIWKHHYKIWNFSYLSHPKIVQHGPLSMKITQFTQLWFWKKNSDHFGLFMTVKIIEGATAPAAPPAPTPLFSHVYWRNDEISVCVCVCACVFCFHGHRAWVE